MIESFTDFKESLLCLRNALFRSRANAYADAIEKAGAPLLRCVGFVDRTKIRISKLGHHGILQSLVYSKHKLMYCLIY